MEGLTTRQANQLLDKYGQNILLDRGKKSILINFFEQFNNFLTILLIVCTVLAFIIGDKLDAVLIGCIVLVNALFGIYQEKKAEASIDALKKMSVTKVRVLRDGQEQELDSAFLVPGDVVLLEEGGKIPADGTLYESIGFEANEAVLTGESLPVPKKDKDAIYSGTIVAKGRGRLIIQSTGMDTKFGKIAKELSSIDDAETPLQIKLKEISRIIGFIGIGLSIIVFIFSLLNGASQYTSFLLAISLAVAIVPEGLPAVMTVTLAIGVGEMTKRKAIIRKLSAIETLGNITLIATDKTGTLTTNKMKVKEIYADGEVFNNERLPSVTKRSFGQLAINGVLCSTASLVYVHDHGRWDVLGDPTEGALLFLAYDVGLIPDQVRKEWDLVQEEAFSSVTKRMTVDVKKKDSNSIISYTKGAPESIIPLCNHLTKDDKKKINDQITMWARKGLRVLALGYKESRSSSFTFSGMVAIHDAPRPEVRDAVLKAKQAGIKVVMVTGDNELTAEAVGVMTGILNLEEDILTGQQIDSYSDEQLLKLLPRVRICARTSPFQKHRIVKLYQQLGEIVAVTGDGVNDTIALKQADVGIAMGLIGTDVAREVADMVLTDDNFASIINAVEEGRNIVRNIRHVTKYLLASNMAEAFCLVVGLMFGVPSLFYATQLLYINLITDGLPALALAFSPRDGNVMRNSTERNIRLLGKKEIKYILGAGLFSSVLVLASYYVFNQIGGMELGKTAAFSVLAIIPSFLLMDVWLNHRPVLHHLKLLFSPIFLIAFSIPFIGQILILSVPFLSEVFKVQPVGLNYIVVFIGIASIIFFGIEIRHHVRKFHTG